MKREWKDLKELEILKVMAEGKESNHIHRATRNGAWLTSVPHRLNGTELSQEEFRDNLCLIYVLITQDITETCNGCGKKFSVYQSLS